MSESFPTRNPSSPEWWRTFFSGSWLDVMNAGMKPPAVSAEEADYVHTMLGLQPGSKVLDVPSGDGRLGIPIAETGCVVSGVELEPSLVDISNREAQRLGVSFTARAGDMRDLPWFDEFDAAFCFFASFGYLDDDGDRAFLEAVWRALQPGAPLLLDLLTMESVLPGFVAKDWFEAGEWTVLEERRFDHASGRIHGDWTFFQDGVVERKTTSVRLYAYQELVGMLTSCGFGDFEAYETLTDTPFSMDADRLTLIARKRV